jgi:hypothetical protein
MLRCHCELRRNASAKSKAGPPAVPYAGPTRADVKHAAFVNVFCLDGCPRTCARYCSASATIADSYLLYPLDTQAPAPGQHARTRDPEVEALRLLDWDGVCRCASQAPHILAVWQASRGPARARAGPGRGYQVAVGAAAVTHLEPSFTNKSVPQLSDQRYMLHAVMQAAGYLLLHPHGSSALLVGRDPAGR